MQTTIKCLLSSGFIAALLATPLPLLAQTAHGHAEHASAAPVRGKSAQTRDALRDLWLGHAFWVRAVVTETLGGNAPAAAVAEKEAVNNARQLAAAMERFYGKQAAGDVFNLLSGHYTAVKQYLLTTQANDVKGQDSARQAMLKNADEISIFLSRANPHLPVDAVRGMLLAHGGHHLQQIHQVAAKDYSREAETWEEMKSHMYAIADAMSGALIKQFPARFL